VLDVLTLLFQLRKQLGADVAT